MDHIRKIQTIVDESRERLPTGVATDIMQECQNAFKDKSELCHVCVTWFHTSTHVTPGEGYDDDKVNTKTIHHTQNLLLEAIDACTPDLHYTADLINRGKAFKSWFTVPKPIIFGTENSIVPSSERVCIVHSIERLDQPPGAAKKRAREQE